MTIKVYKDPNLQKAYYEIQEMIRLKNEGIDTISVKKEESKEIVFKSFPKIKSAKHALREIIKLCTDKHKYGIEHNYYEKFTIKLSLIKKFAVDGLKNESKNR